jgi:hypothetical protein
MRAYRYECSCSRMVAPSCRHATTRTTLLLLNLEPERAPAKDRLVSPIAETHLFRSMHPCLAAICRGELERLGGTHPDFEDGRLSAERFLEDAGAIIELAPIIDVGQLAVEWPCVLPLIAAWACARPVCTVNTPAAINPPTTAKTEFFIPFPSAIWLPEEPVRSHWRARLPLKTPARQAKCLCGERVLPSRTTWFTSFPDHRFRIRFVPGRCGTGE